MSSFQEQEYNNNKFDLKLWKKILYYAKPLRKELILLCFLMVSLAVIDAIFPLMTKFIIDNYVVNSNLKGITLFNRIYIDGIIVFGIIYGVLVLIQVGTIGFFIAIAGKIETGVVYEIRKEGFKHLQELSFSYYDNTPVGWIMARMTSDVQRLGDTIAWGIVDMVWGFTLMIAISIVMLLLNWKLALIVLSVMPILAVVSMYFQKKILKAHRQTRKINSRITGAFNEGIMGARTTKTLVREEGNLHEFVELTKSMKTYSVRAAVFSSLFQPVVLVLSTIGTGLALWYGGENVFLQAISYGTLVAFISYTVSFFEPVREVARVFAELQSAQASAERVLSMIDTKLEIKDSEDVAAEYGDSLNPNKKDWPEIKGDITYKDVTFAYNTGEKVLENFNLHIKAGETIALVGETGSGKSTIVNLACRFYEPTKGQIFIDGVDYKKMPLLWLHSNLGYVLQGPHLFSGTIKDNIRYGNLDASELEIIRAAKLVNAHDFIKKLEKGYDTEVGEGGSKLSTGEKQLISFARAILANPRIFVLDEATSSIDTETEQKIQDAIHKVLKGRTSFIIAHRLSTIRTADRILVIKDGKIIEEGNHLKLLKKRGYYYRLYTNQFIEEQNAKVLKG
ncbi:ATP-binding cassette, subfamily B [Proteiniborus ethanoligenes]|uniref:ATP-binding cassette, subfamily B n=1 Tax=Proteiniborus ethanoligenes TaxID=415015 RepID=A0A1H3RQ72_9FIRM|nr:ABC transporter ATP-binding protein [Proteiniborus ethanoligenes]SDZ27773.1 ATP-binding cassette, subfamily B [Proteiniborus ethanoligenes]